MKVKQDDWSETSCYHYDRDDWLKSDVELFLSPWVSRVSEIFKIKKKPAKYLVVYALSLIIIPKRQEILDAALIIFNDRKNFQKKYGTRLIPNAPDLNFLLNPKCIIPPCPRQVNFMDLVDYWAKPINQHTSIGIGQCRDVVKIVLTLFLSDHTIKLSKKIMWLTENLDNELFSGNDKINFTR